jgi:LPXTG-motif cell wall-anchored protein
MQTLDPGTWNIVIAAAMIIVLLAIGAWVAYRRRQSHELRRRFGPEYGRTVRALGDRGRAAAALRTRDTRVAKLPLDA